MNAMTDNHDADLAVITDYCLGDLTADEARAVEERLMDDAEFLARAEATISLFATIEENRDELRQTLKAAMPRPAAVRPSRWARIRHARVLGMPVLPSKRSMVQMAWAAGLVLAALGVGAPFGVDFATASYHALGRIASGRPIGGEVRSSAPNGTQRRIPLRDSSVVELRGPASYAWHGHAWIDVAVVDGEAAITLTAAESPLVVETPHGDVLLRAGRYALRVDAARKRLLVATAEGTAYLLGAAPTNIRRVDAGEFGFIEEGRPFLTHNADGYPVPPTPGTPSPLHRR